MLKGILDDGDLIIIRDEMAKFIGRSFRTKVARKDIPAMRKFCLMLRTIISHDYEINFKSMEKMPTQENLNRERLLNILCEKCLDILGQRKMECTLNHMDCSDCTGWLVYTTKGYKMGREGQGHLCSIAKAIRGEI